MWTPEGQIQREAFLVDLFAVAVTLEQVSNPGGWLSDDDEREVRDLLAAALSSVDAILQVIGASERESPYVGPERRKRVTLSRSVPGQG